jgi:hypothetical protein
MYVGTYFQDPLLQALFPLWRNLKGFPKPLPGHRPGLHVVCRENKKLKLWFYMNETEKPISLSKLPSGRVLVTPQGSRKPRRLEPNEVLVIEES